MVFILFNTTISTNKIKSSLESVPLMCRNYKWRERNMQLLRMRNLYTFDGNYVMASVVEFKIKPFLVK